MLLFFVLSSPVYFPILSRQPAQTYLFYSLPVIHEHVLVVVMTFRLCVCGVGMIGYGMAKAAVHQLVQSMSEPSSGLPEDAAVLGILP